MITPFNTKTPSRSTLDKALLFAPLCNCKQGTLAKGQQVEFEIGEGQKGPMAVNVRVLIED